MGIMATEGGKQRKLIPQGMHDAVNFMVVDIGTQFNPAFGTSSRKVLLGWEFPDHRIKTDDSDRPMVSSKTFTLSLHEKATLRKTLESWRGTKFTQEQLAKGFDISKLLGVNCQIQILHEEKNGKVYDNIANILPPKSGKIAVVNTENEHLYYSMDDNMEIPANLYDWIVKRIKESEEYSNVQEEPDGPEGPDFDDYSDEEDQIPF